MKSLQTIWNAAKEALGVVVIIWAVALVTLLVWRITTPEAIANADIAYWGVITAIITLATVPIHWWFKRKQAAKNNCPPCDK